MKNNKYSRRKFLGKYLYTGTLFLGGGLVLGCTSMRSVAKDLPDSVHSEDPKPPAQDTLESIAQQPGQNQKNAVVKKNPCDDLTGVSQEEVEKRKKLAYVNKTPIPDSHCSNCALYLPPGKDKACGGCLLFKGPVRPEGYCAYWAPITN